MWGGGGIAVPSLLPGKSVQSLRKKELRSGLSMDSGVWPEGLHFFCQGF
jgi:hypothetical protein